MKIYTFSSLGGAVFPYYKPILTIWSALNSIQASRINFSMSKLIRTLSGGV